MPRKRKVEITPDFLYARGIRVPLSTLREMVLEALERMQRTLDQPAPELTEDEIAALQHRDIR